MTEEYTPATEDVRAAATNDTGRYYLDEDAFDRWLRHLIAAEQAKGHKLGYGQGWSDGYSAADYDNVQEQNMSF